MTPTRTVPSGNQTISVKPLPDGSWLVGIGFAKRQVTTIIIPADAPARLFAPVETAV